MLAEAGTVVNMGAQQQAAWAGALPSSAYVDRASGVVMDILQERLARARERDATAVPDQARRADLGFEALHRYAEGGLPYPQQPGSTGEVPTARAGLAGGDWSIHRPRELFPAPSCQRRHREG
jgi:hypothetical protein